MKNLVQLSRSVIMVIGLLVASLSQAQEYDAPLSEGQGVIQGLDFGANTTVINGTDYRVSPTVKVEIGGSFGAFTMLQDGMNVVFNYLQYSDGSREITELQQVAEVEAY